MKRLILLFPFILLIAACGGGSGSSGSPDSPASALSLYSGKKTQAVLNESNYLDFVRVLYGNNNEVITTPLSLEAQSRTTKEVNSLSTNINFEILDLISSNFFVSPQLSQLSQTRQFSHRSVSETGYCEQGTSKITGDLDDSKFTGKLVTQYNNCQNQGITLDGSATLEIFKYNVNAEDLEHYTVSFNGLNVSDNNNSTTFTGNSEVKVDFTTGTETSIDNILIDGEKQILFENYTTIETYPNISSVLGKVYLENHGYVVISTDSPLVNTLYYEGFDLPTSGGPLNIEGENQTVSLYPQETGNRLQIEYTNDSGVLVREGFIDTDYQGPELISITPTPGSADVPLDSIIVMEFDEPIDPSFIDTTDNYLRTIRNYRYVWVPTITRVSDNKIILTPLEPLKHGEVYEFLIDEAYLTNNVIRDMRGNSSYFQHDTWPFKTIEYGEEINLGLEIDSFELDKSTNRLYALDTKNKKLVIVNLTTDKVEKTYSIPVEPSDLCLDTSTDRIYITSMENSLIEEYRLSDFQNMASISWSAVDSSYDEKGADYEIQCIGDDLYVLNASWTPELYKINRSAPYQETYLNIDGVGSFVKSTSGNLYTWFQFGWNAGIASSYIRSFIERQDGSWSLLGESDNRDLQHPRNPLDSPIFIDESYGHVINKRYIFSLSDLSEVVHDFGEDKVIYAADFSRNRIATLTEVYSTVDYSSLFTIPMYDADNSLFDNEGDLYIIKNKNLSLYRINENEM